MHLRIDIDSGIPIYHQIAEQIKQIAAAGGIRPGEKLPSVRSLAVKLRVNPNTVQAAYRHLETEGTVDTRRGLGVFLTGTVRRMTLKERTRALALILDQVVLKAHQLGLNDREAVNLLKERLEAFRHRIASGRSIGGQKK